MKTAIVTLTLGRPYELAWNEVCAPSWRAYAARHGYDVVAINQPLDNSMRAAFRIVPWQKLLTLQPHIVGGYDRVIWLDADIVINPNAPPIVDGVPSEKVGVVDESLFPDRETYRTIRRDAAARFRAEGDLIGAAEMERLALGDTPTLNAGVLVTSPAHHRELFEHIYRTCEQDRPWAEQSHLALALHARGLIHWLDPRFNAIVGLLLRQEHKRSPLNTEADISAAIQRWLSQNFFLHFAGAQRFMSVLAPSQAA